jgi:excisionase family DNA binding protein
MAIPRKSNRRPLQHAGRPRTQKIRDLATYPYRFVTPMQLAAYVGVSRRTIYHHIDKGALAAVKIGGAVRIALAEAQRYAGGVPVFARLSAPSAPSATAISV